LPIELVFEKEEEAAKEYNAAAIQTEDIDLF
jgi:hypothetical protein